MTTTNQPLAAPASPLKPTAGRVVVGVDGSERGLEALRYAAAVAQWQNWTLHIVHAWQYSYPVSPLVIGLGEIIEAATDAAEVTVRDAEKEALQDGFAGDVRRTVTEGRAAQVLVDLSKGADLVVVGSRGLGGFASLALGSVGQACVHHAHCPVLIVRAKL